MPSISFALILSENLAQKRLKLKQCETVVEVTGATDPTTLQLMRDDPAVKDCFQARRTTLNALIKKAVEGLETLAKAHKGKVEAQKVRDAFNEAYKLQIAAFEKALTEKVTNFCKTNTTTQQQYNTGLLKFTIRTAWTIGELIWNVSEVVGGAVAAPATGGAAMAVAAKGVADFALTLVKVIGEVRTACNSADEQRKKIVAALTAIKQNKDKLTQSHITAAESALAPFGPKVLSVENTAKTLSADLEAVLAKTEKAKFGPKKTAKLETTIDAMIKKIIKLNEEVAAARKFQQSAKDKIKAAVEGAKKPGYDFKTFVAWVVSNYEAANDYFEKAMLDNLTDAAKMLAKQALEDDDD